MSKDEAPNFRWTTPDNCLNCEHSRLDSFDHEDVSVYICNKYDFLIPRDLLSHVCDGYEDS